MRLASDSQDTERAFLGFLGSLAAGAALWWTQARFRYATFPTTDFIQPEALADIAAQIPTNTEDQFILSAWRAVGGQIAYEPVGSEITFVNSHVRCLKCFLPAQVRARKKANCVGKSSLLASLLATRLAPERVAMAVGELRRDDVGGHAWVAVRRGDGEWYILESTHVPGATPWLRVEDAPDYVPFAYIGGAGAFECWDEKLCISVSGCRCLDKILSVGVT